MNCSRKRPATTDMTRHPARPLHNLNEVHAKSRLGLEQTFPVGSLWHYGPLRENMEEVVRVVRKDSGSQVFTSGKNYSRRPEDINAFGRPTVYINCEIVYSPFPSRIVGTTTGFPPHTLIPRAAVLAERGPSALRDWDDGCPPCTHSYCGRYEDGRHDMACPNYVPAPFVVCPPCCDSLEGMVKVWWSGDGWQYCLPPDPCEELSVRLEDARSHIRALERQIVKQGQVIHAAKLDAARQRRAANAALTKLARVRRAAQ